MDLVGVYTPVVFVKVSDDGVLEATYDWTDSFQYVHDSDGGNGANWDYFGGESDAVDAYMDRLTEGLERSSLPIKTVTNAIESVTYKTKGGRPQ